MGWIGKIAVGLPCAAVSLGLAYQWVSTKLDESRYPAPGRLVDVGGYRLHIHGMGEGKGPSVILDAGGGCSSLDWGLVQPEIAKFAQVYSYDRAGHGWSDESQKSKNSQNMVQDLHMLLKNENISPPYILVGHSLGGLNVRLYASLYPNEVAAVVLVDAAHEKMLDQSPPPPEPSWMQNILTSQKMGLLLTRLGLMRLLIPLQMHKVLEVLPKESRAIYCAKNSTISSIKTKFEEGAVARLKESMQQVKDATEDLGDKPLIVITAKSLQYGLNMSEYPQKVQHYISEMSKVHHRLQKDLVQRSTQGKQVIAENSGHMIPVEQPAIIVDAVRELVEQHRDKELENFDTLFVGDPVVIEKNLRELLPRASAYSNKSLLPQILSQVALSQAMQQNFDKAHATLDEAERVCLSDDYLAKVRILLERGRVYHQAGHLNLAQPLFEESYVLSLKHGFDDQTCNAAHMVAIVVKKAEEKICWNERAIALAEQSDMPRAKAWLGSLYNNLGAAYLEAKQYEKALSIFEKTLGLREVEGIESNIYVAKWQITRALRYLDPEKALVMLFELKDRCEKMTEPLDEMNKVLRGYVYAEIAETYAGLKNIMETKAFAEKAYKDLSETECACRFEPEKLVRLQKLKNE